MRSIALWHGDESTYIKYDSEFGKVIKCNVLHLPGEERSHRVNSAKETLVEERKWISMESINTMHKHLSRVFKKQLSRIVLHARQAKSLEWRIRRQSHYYIAKSACFLYRYM